MPEPTGPSLTSADFRAAAQRMRADDFLAWTETFERLADWVEQTAERHESSQLPTAPAGFTICRTCDKGPERYHELRAPCPDWTSAEAVVRAFLAGRSITWTVRGSTSPQRRSARGTSRHA